MRVCVVCVCCVCVLVWVLCVCVACVCVCGVLVLHMGGCESVYPCARTGLCVHACLRVQAHHAKSCWLTPQLEACWQLMISEGSRTSLRRPSHLHAGLRRSARGWCAARPRFGGAGGAAHALYYSPR